MDQSREAKTRAALGRIYAANYEKIMARVQVVEEALACLQKETLLPDQRRHAEGEAHKLAGVLGTFGFAQGTVLAREIEGVLKGMEAIPPAVVSRLRDLTDGLRQELKAPEV